MNWYKIKNAESPKIHPISRNSYGEATVFILGKEYRYINVSYIEWERLSEFVKHQNYRSAFALLQKLTMDPLFHKKPQNRQKTLFD
jgi:hypothetical protein